MGRVPSSPRARRAARRRSCPRAFRARSARGRRGNATRTSATGSSKAPSRGLPAPLGYTIQAAVFGMENHRSVDALFDVVFPVGVGGATRDPFEPDHEAVFDLNPHGPISEPHRGGLFLAGHDRLQPRSRRRPASVPSGAYSKTSIQSQKPEKTFFASSRREATTVIRFTSSPSSVSPTTRYRTSAGTVTLSALGSFSAIQVPMLACERRYPRRLSPSATRIWETNLGKRSALPPASLMRASTNARSRFVMAEVGRRLDVDVVPISDGEGAPDVVLGEFQGAPNALVKEREREGVHGAVHRRLGRPRGADGGQPFEEHDLVDVVLDLDRVVDRTRPRVTATGAGHAASKASLSVARSSSATRAPTAKPPMWQPNETPPAEPVKAFQTLRPAYATANPSSLGRTTAATARRPNRAPEAPTRGSVAEGFTREWRPTP